MLILAGDNPERIRSEAAFAKLCGARRAVAIPMIAKTKNMRRYGKDSWLGRADSNLRMAESKSGIPAFFGFLDIS
jgi:hypothetical protein